MSSISIISQIPALTSTSVTSFVNGLVTAAAKGVKVYISASLYNQLKDTFNELGITLREVKGEITDDTFIIVKSAGIRIRIEVYEGGSRVNSLTTTVKAFEKALKEYIEQKKGKKSEPSFYEVILPDDMKIILEGGEDEDQ